MKRILLLLGAFLYTLLYGFAVNRNGFVFIILVNFLLNVNSGNGMNFMTIFFIMILNSAVILLVIFQYEKFKGSIIFMYISSLFASFLIPFVHNWNVSGGFLPPPPKTETATILLIANIICGPAMFLLISNLFMKIILNRRRRI